MERVGKHFDTRKTASVCRTSCSVNTVLQDMSVAVEKLRVIEVLSMMQGLCLQKPGIVGTRRRNVPCRKLISMNFRSSSSYMRD